jgi:hypothetical protein
MRNKALPLKSEQSVQTPFAPSLEPIPTTTRDKQTKGKNKQQSKVMLGMPDVPIEEHLDNDGYATKIGGIPVGPLKLSSFLFFFFTEKALYSDI